MVRLIKIINLMLSRWELLQALKIIQIDVLLATYLKLLKKIGI